MSRKQTRIFIITTVLFALASCNKMQQETNSDLAPTKCTSYKEYIENSLPPGTIDDRGQRTRDEIKNGISTSVPKLRALIRKYPNIAGQIILSIGVNNCGDVDTCFVKISKIHDTVFVNEVIQIVRMVKFDKVDREDNYFLFDFPFNFTQDEKEK